ncbi:MAG: EAL domain-containing protein [Sulfurimonas sp.]|nr:EAL domain-containing protein [Sulfurimonas sp.]
MSTTENPKKDIFILAVEDSKTQAQVIKYFLDARYSSVHLCFDGQEALEWLKSTQIKPDIIISDIQMPRMDGYTLCKAIRADENLKNIPVILLTSLSEPNNIIQSIEAGADKFLVKPFDQTLLSEVIDEAYINMQRRAEKGADDVISLRFGGNDFFIAADKVRLLDLLLSSYEDSYYKSTQLQEARSDLESLNGELEEKVQERTKELLIKEEQFRTLSENTPNLIARIDKNLNFVYVNEAIEKLFGISREELIGKPVSMLEDAIDGYSCSDAVKELFSSAKAVRREIRIDIPSKGVVWLDATYVLEYDDKGEISYALNVSTDITERKEAEIELHKLSQAVEQSQNSIILIDTYGTIEYVNASFTKLTGYAGAEAVGKNINQFHSKSAICDDILTQLKLSKSFDAECTNKRKDGTQYIEMVIASPIYQADGEITHYMISKDDITDNKLAQERINYLANFDLLTGLPNRATLEDRINFAISFSKRNNEKFAVLFLDIDHFKDINDTLGHTVGDILLVELSKRFQQFIHEENREEDIVSRLGGDEFIFLMLPIDIATIARLLQRLLNIISKPFLIEQNELVVTASIGVALFPDDGTTQEILSKNADAALHHAKEEGRNCYRFFTEKMQEDSSINLQLNNALFHALEEEQLHVVYQPQISLHNDTVIGAEALLRWTHPTLGNIPPDKFIHLAEQNGLILQIGEWVMRSAVKQMQSWIESGLAPMIIAVNLSAVQFRHANLPELITDILKETKLLPQYLEIELTEAAAMNDPAHACKIMDDLHDCGIRMAIDDFGTGYSSLSYLKRFEVYKLKIDQSFVRDIDTNPEDRAIVKAIIVLSKSLGITTIAEGVETVEQLDCLREEGCDEIQGYYYSKPLRAEEFEAFVRERSNSQKA